MAEIDERQRVTVTEDVVYGTGGGRELRLDVYEPPAAVRGDEPAPAVLLVHGGSWRGGNRKQLGRYGLRLGRVGYVCLAIEYRLIPETWFPGFVHDVKAAIRWTRANCVSLGIDPERIGIHGNSAGGHLALLAAGTPGVEELEGDGGNPGVSSAVQACSSVYGPSVFHVGDPDVGTRPVTRLSEEASEEVARLASPLRWVSPSFPPTLLQHGVRDELVPVAASQLMHDALTDAGVPSELHLYPEQPHGYDSRPEFGRHSSQQVAFFFDRYLRRSIAPVVARRTRAQAAAAPSAG